VDRAAMVADPQPADRDAFDGAARRVDRDLFAQAEGVIEQGDDAGYDIAHQGLRTEAWWFPVACEGPLPR
jgi:hypothetical protein